MDDKNRSLLIDLICEVYRYSKSNDKLAIFVRQFQPNLYKKYESAALRLQKKLQVCLEAANVEILELSGEYGPELPVEVLNMDDFEENDILVISEFVEPVIKEKGSSQIIKYGKVLLKKK